MPRDFEALYRAQQQTTAAATRNESISLPPGYLVGFDVRLRQDYTVLITAGACNIRGRLVQIKEDHQLADADWVAPKINSTRHYYIYLSLAGQWFVDIVAPVWNNQYLYWEQPDTNWRAVGKVFISGGQLLFAIKEVEKNEQTVTVAPAGFTGKADYYCTGTDDQILIHAAIRYLHEAYDGGECRFLPGDYYPKTINVEYNNISLIGSGPSTVFNSSGSTYGINLAATSGGLYYTNLAAFTIKPAGSSYCLTACIYGNNILGTWITEVMVNNANAYGMLLNADSGCHVNKCRVLNFGLVSTSYGIYVSVTGGAAASGDITECSVVQTVSALTTGLVGISISYGRAINNLVQGLNTTGDGCALRADGSGSVLSNNHAASIAGGDFDGILVLGDDCVVSNNSVSGITGTVVGDGIRVVGANNCVISDNVCYNCGDYGINITSGASLKFTGNYCRNNGSDTGIANANQNNFYDAGTDTQVYSNSWQQPVAGEPSLGTRHPTTGTIFSATTITQSQSYTIGSTTSGLPANATKVNGVVYGVGGSGSACILSFGLTTTTPLDRYYNYTGSYVSDHVEFSVSAGAYKIWAPSAGWNFVYFFQQGYTV